MAEKSCKKLSGKKGVRKVIRDKCLVCKNLIRGEVKMRCEMCTRPVHKTCSGRSRWAADHEGSWKCGDCKPEKVDDEEEEKR